MATEGAASRLRGTARAVPAPVLVLVAIGSVQTGSAIARTAFDVTGAAGVTLLRLGVSGLLLTALVRPSVRRWTRTQWSAAVTLGLTMGAMNLVFYLAIREVPLGVAVTVEFVGPLLVALVQTRRARDLLWVLLAGAGVALLGLEGGSAVPLGGLALALLAGMFWAGYILASARVGRLLPGVDGLAVACSWRRCWPCRSARPVPGGPWPTAARWRPASPWPCCPPWCPMRSS